MRRYFFDFDDDRAPYRDDEGVLLTDAAEAEKEAFKGLADLLFDRFSRGELTSVRMEVRDEEGRTVLQTSVIVEHLMAAG